MIQAVDYVMSATTCFLRKDNSSSNNTFDNVPYFHDGEDFLCPEDEKHNCTKSRRLDRLVKFSHVRRKDDLFPETFQQCLNKLLSADSPVPFPNTNNETNSTSVTDTDSHFAYDPHRKNILPEHYAGAAERGSGWGEGAFYLLNTVDDGRGHRIWSKVGYITCSGERDLKTVLWPGKSKRRHTMYTTNLNK
ncbi:uncharacterized protein LOC106012209 [Aplysia californica]|uniref:Uncharacterized protein LOC106012209 n=1 Tax=Aplysia californica TaxID=6500 RepID=A0ABM1A349_APLCA|nr:uncharacterized protein LOC106012209 [Aplysia californica]